MGSFIAMAGILIVLVILFFISFTGYQVLVKRQEILKARLEEFVGPDGKTLQTGKTVEARSSFLKEKSDVLQNIGTIITPEKIKEAIQLKLSMAGVPLRPNEYVAIIFFSTILPFIFASLIFKRLVLGIILAIFGFLAPQIWLWWKKTQRMNAFNSQLLDMLILVSNGLKAGYSFLQAIEMIERESPPPMSTEFRRVLRENSLGVPIEVSLENMTKRVESPDFDLLVTVVLIQKEVGGNLAEILDSIANTIRERMRIKGQIQTLTAQGRLSGIIVGALPFALALAIYVFNPDYFLNKFLFYQYNGTYPGMYMIGFGLFMQAIGALIIKQIITIDV